MAEDGLLFRFLAKISPKSKTPVIATLTSGVVAAVMAFLFDLKDLVDLMSIGTLLAYTLVAACVLVLRYQPEQPSAVLPYQAASQEEAEAEAEAMIESNSGILPPEDNFSVQKVLFPKNTDPSRFSGSVVNTCTSVLGLLVCMFCLIAAQETALAPWSLTLLVLLAVLCMTVTLVIGKQPQSKTKLSFKVPLLPVLPVISMFINVYLMMQLGRGTWVRFVIWMVIGFLIYFCYGLWNSTEAALAKSNTTADIASFKELMNGHAATTEKEAFFGNGVDTPGDEDSDP